MNALRDLQKYAITSGFFEDFKCNEPINSLQHSNKFNNNRISLMNDVPKENKILNYQNLFWTTYSLITNEHMASMMENHKFKIKNDFSMRFVEDIKKNKGFLKENKLKFHDIESSILYDKDINIDTFKALILFKKMNVFYIWNNRYYIFESNDDDIFNVIIRKRETITFERDVTKKYILENLANDKILMDNTRTQLKSVSSYKLDELKKMASLLGFETEKRKTKHQLYQEINSKID